MNFRKSHPSLLYLKALLSRMHHQSYHPTYNTSPLVIHSLALLPAAASPVRGLHAYILSRQAYARLSSVSLSFHLFTVSSLTNVNQLCVGTDDRVVISPVEGKAT